MASLFTSRYATEVGVRSLEWKSGMRHLKHFSVTSLPDKHVTLAEMFKQEGYMTISVTTNGLSAGLVNMVQGFNKQSHLVYKDAETVTSRAIRYLEDDVSPRNDGQGNRPFFMYIHYIDVHEPNRPPAPYDTLYPTLDNAPHTKEHTRWGFKNGTGLNEKDFLVFKSHKVALYDGAIRFVDDQIGRLVRCMKELGLYRDSVIVIASDHGEELWDHALFEKKYKHDPRNYFGIGHGHTMFSELLHVPLVFHGKHVPKNLRVGQQVRNMDIAATLLGLADVEHEVDSLRGVDLLRLLRSGRLEDLLSFSEDIAYGYEEKCIQDGQYKLVMGKDYLFLFNKSHRPYDTENLANKMPALKNSLSGRLSDILSSLQEDHGDPVLFNEKVKEHLEELGYLQ